MNTSIANEIAYKNIRHIQKDLSDLTKMGFLSKKVDQRPLIIAHYDALDAGNRSYIKWQEDISKVLGIPYKAWNSNQFSDPTKVLDCINNQNKIDLIGALFIANPLNKNLNFQDAIDSVDPIKEIDGLSTFHKSKYMQNIAENLEWVYFHPTALSVISVLQETLGEDLTNKKILVAWWWGKVWSMICALIQLVWAIPQVYNTMPGDYNPDELEALLPNHDGFVCAIRGAEMFDGALFNNFQWPIIDITTAKNWWDKTVWWIKIATLDAKKNDLYISPNKNGIGTITKTQLMANYVRAITQKMKIRDAKDSKCFDNLIHQTNNSDIVGAVEAVTK